MQQRYYDPVIGRFYSNDPVGFSADSPMSFNRYLYVDNNPYKYTDPTGEVKVEIKFEAQLVVGGGAKVSVGGYVDTDTLEAGATVSGGPRIGLEAGVGLSVGISESSTSPAESGLGSSASVDGSISAGFVGAGKEITSSDGSLNSLAGGLSGSGNASLKDVNIGKVGLSVGGSVGATFTGKASTDALKVGADTLNKAASASGLNQGKISQAMDSLKR